MKKLLAAIALIIILPGFAMAGGDFIGSRFPGVPSLGDPCITFPHSTIHASISSATTTSLVAPVTGQDIYVCGYTIFHPGGVGTIGLETGTGSTCGTGTTVLSPIVAGSTTAGTGTFDGVGYVGYEVLNTKAVANGRLCAVSTGTIAQEISVDYVQK